MRSARSREPTSTPRLLLTRRRGAGHKDGGEHLPAPVARRPTRLPPRVESPEPTDGSPEPPSTSDDGTTGEEDVVRAVTTADWKGARHVYGLGSQDDEGPYSKVENVSEDDSEGSEWVDEEEEIEGHLKFDSGSARATDTANQERYDWKSRWYTVRQAVSRYSEM